MIKIEKSWQKVLSAEFKKDYWKNLANFLDREIKSGKQIFPNQKDIFAGFSLCPFDKVKVVVIGQDPYHSISTIETNSNSSVQKKIPTAHGLCFSVVKGAKIPPSLRNIYKELQNEFPRNFEIPNHGNLEKWAKQGVLLLNTTLTVEAHKPMSHVGKGWEEFTDKVIETISREKTGIVFLLWGKHAQSLKKIINLEKHFVLESAHPSPFSAHRGFLGCGHFTKVNELLKDEKIDWQV